MIALNRWILSVAASSLLSYTSTAAEAVILESHVISHIDGLFIKADLIECMHKARKELIAIIEQYRLHEHAQQEITSGILTPEEQIFFTQAKEAVKRIVHNFAGNTSTAKGILTMLIKEDCLKRNRLDSPLLNWTEIPEEQEELAFEQNIINARVLYTFCVDLANFLHDLIQSCPKACALFNERRAKEHHIFTLLPAALKKYNLPQATDSTIAFFKFVKKEHIDELQREDITQETVEKLLAEYIKKTS